MRDLYPGYDVLAKRDTASWNEQTRRAIDRRLSIDPEAHCFFDDSEWETLRALCNRVVPQPAERVQAVPVAALVDLRMHEDRRDGYRDARLPPMGTAWRVALAAIDQEAAARYATRFHDLPSLLQDDLLRAMQRGELTHDAWGSMPPQVFFEKRVIVDVVRAYYSHPTAWNEIGWGGPASPRGYVRMDFDRRDPWEAAEAAAGQEHRAYRENLRVGT